MNPSPDLPNRLKADSPDLGHASQAEIELRAMELARSDGRDFFTDADLTRAAAELAAAAAAPSAPEVDPTLEQVTAWDEVPEQAGHRVEPLPLDDEGNVAEQLIQDCLEEADHAIRAAAEDDEAGEEEA